MTGIQGRLGAMPSRRSVSSTIAVRALLALVVTGALSACVHRRLSPEEMAARVNVSTCPPGVPAKSPTEAPPPGNLTLTITTEPQVAEGTELTLRLDGETTRSSIRIDATKPTGYSLAEGVYVVRAGLPGYTGVEGRVVLTAGCEATMTMQLKKPTR